MADQRRGVSERLRMKLKMRLLDLYESGPQQRGVVGYGRPELRERLKKLVTSLPGEVGETPPPPHEQDRLIEELLDDVVGLGPLEPLLNDPTVTEIMINGPNEIVVERDGTLHHLPTSFRDASHLMGVVERLLGPVGLTLNESEPICDASLPDGSRLNVIIPPLVLNGPTITIRRKLPAWTMAEYLTVGALSDEAAWFLEACVKAKVNLVISGGTSTGKTTLVTILSAFIPPRERVITIENVPELDLKGREHWIRLVARAPNLQGQGEVPLRALVKNALRMRPDRLVLGEARGGEALDVVQGMQAGHDGVITVLHANSPHAALERLETLMLMSGVGLPPQACRLQIANAVQVVVHLDRFADGSRRIASITQVRGLNQDAFDLQDLFRFETDGTLRDGKLNGRLRYMETRPAFLEKFQLHQLTVPAWVTA